MKSKLFWLDKQDFMKGLIMAIILPILTVIEESLQSGSLQFDIKKIIIAALLGLIAYIIKNFFTNSQDKFLKSEKNS